MEGFHNVEAVLQPVRGWQLTPQLRFRTVDRLSTLLQIRPGLIVTKTLTPTFDLIGAGYWEPTVRKPRFWESWRVQVGGQFRWRLGRSLAAQPRLLWERLNRSTGLGYERFRLGNRLILRNGSIRPFLNQEIFATAKASGGISPGFHSFRAGGGVTVDATAHIRLEFDYAYDIRRAVWGGDRQIVGTRLQFR